MQTKIMMKEKMNSKIKLQATRFDSRSWTTAVGTLLLSTQKFFTLLLFARSFKTSSYSIMGPSLEYLIDYQIMMG